MDNLDKLTLVLLVCLVVVALIFPLSAGRHRDRPERPHDRSR
ncbi:hypothetical protein [Herbaspirillum sp. YR522]|nr:hypothetical protein [Herbaspirillum sp. YR522]EJM98226.1 hypothetical protein PMI40_04084 [Herbaspirillum sp. YR522]